MELAELLLMITNMPECKVPQPIAIDTSMIGKFRRAEFGSSQTRGKKLVVLACGFGFEPLSTRYSTRLWMRLA